MVETKVTNLIRVRAIDAVARRLAMYDSYKWERAPTSEQARKQAMYQGRAADLVTMIEQSMRDWTWNHEIPT